MTASPPPPVPPLVRALLDVREILERARRTGDRREIEAAVVALTYRATIDQPQRFVHARAVGAHVGLTPTYSIPVHATGQFL